MIAVEPKLHAGCKSTAILEAAVPWLLEASNEPELPCSVVIAPGPTVKLAEALVEKLYLSVTDSVNELDLIEALRGEVHMGITQDGWCPCGKRTYLLLRCRSCRNLLAGEAQERVHPWRWHLAGEEVAQFAVAAVSGIFGSNC